jgi:hypothetical protein
MKMTIFLALDVLMTVTTAFPELTPVQRVLVAGLILCAVHMARKSPQGLLED